MLVTGPAFSTPVVVNVKVKVWFWASTIAPVLPCASQAALAAPVRLPRTLSETLLMVTGSVLAVLVFLIVKV